MPLYICNRSFARTQTMSCHLTDFRPGYKRFHFFKRDHMVDTCNDPCFRLALIGHELFFWGEQKSSLALKTMGRIRFGTKRVYNDYD